jgi:hypothetical protein
MYSLESPDISRSIQPSILPSLDMDIYDSFTCLTRCVYKKDRWYIISWNSVICFSMISSLLMTGLMLRSETAHNKNIYTCRLIYSDVITPIKNPDIKLINLSILVSNKIPFVQNTTEICPTEDVKCIYKLLTEFSTLKYCHFKNDKLTYFGHHLDTIRTYRVIIVLMCILFISIVILLYELCYKSIRIRMQHL